MNFENLKKTDPLAYSLVMEETLRQEESIEMIPSECVASLSTIEALWSPFTNKYSEWYARKRYYAGNEVVDKVEELAIERAKKAFPGVVHVNVQPYSWSPANFAIYNALCQPWETILGLALAQGWHLTHGHVVSASAKYFNAVQYGLREDGYIDLEEVERLAFEHKPKVIVVWFTAYSRAFPFKEFRQIADKVDAYLMADISHISWLVVSEVHESPVPYCDVIMTTTHKTLRGPRGAMIMVSQRGIDKDPELAIKIDKSVFPWLQWWPHNHQTLAIAVALWEALTIEYRQMNAQIVKNAHVLAEDLVSYWFEVATGWTDNHLVLAWVWKGRWSFMQDALDTVGIALNKNTIPNEPCSPFFPSWIRMWTPVLTQRGMKESEVRQIAVWMKQVRDVITQFDYSEDKEKRKEINKQFKDFLKNSEELQRIREEVRELCRKFPIYK